MQKSKIEELKLKLTLALSYSKRKINNNFWVMFQVPNKFFTKIYIKLKYLLVNILIYSR